MRKLPISILVLLAGLAFSPFLLAAGMDTAPGPNAPPVDPDYESGKKAIEAQNWKTALDSFESQALALASFSEQGDGFNQLLKGSP